MTRSTWDMVLGLAWILYGTIESSRAAYQFFHFRALAHGSNLQDFIGISPFWVLLALLMVGGAGMALGRRWAWIMTLVLSLLHSVLSAFAVRGLANGWTFLRPPLGQITWELLPYVLLWALTSWTLVRFFVRPRPWNTPARSIA